MAYRKSERVLAQLEAKRQLILGSTIDIIAKTGLEGLTSNTVAARAKVPVGSVFAHFGDMAELQNAALALMAERDIASMTSAAAACAKGSDTEVLACSIAVFFSRANFLSQGFHHEAYALPVRTELAGIIRGASPDLSPRHARWAARAALGAIHALAQDDGHLSDLCQTALAFVLRGIAVRGASRYSMA
jgi:AcrR family transcriptional regulator